MAVDENGVEIVQENMVPVARVHEMTSKIGKMSGELDTARAEKEAADTAKAEMERERDFYSGFADVLSQNPQAKDHKDEILGKVKSGYSVEDATFAVLGKAGKLGQPQVDTQPIAGGSATNTLSQPGSKQVSEMSRDDKRAALMEAEKRGDISFN